MGVRQMIEHDDDGNALRGHVHPVAAPAAQRAAVAGDRSAKLCGPVQAEAVYSGRAVTEAHRG